MTFFFRFFTISLFLLSGFSPLNADTTINETLIPPAQLADKLKKGGYILYIRHASTDHSVDDKHPVDLYNCTTQRNLSQQGREQAKLIGTQIKRLAIPIGDVQSSPYCRCRDTAQLTFGKYVTNKDLYFAVTARPDERQRITGILRNMLSIMPEAGKNNVIVSHTANLREASGIWPKPEGVTWVIEPDGKGGFKSLGKIDPADWVELK